MTTSLSAAGVEYAICGGCAVVICGYVRAADLAMLGLEVETDEA